MNIRNMMKRFQDLDKLKLILLTDHQKKLFEEIPKPTIIKKILLRKNSHCKISKKGKGHVSQRNYRFCIK